MRFNYNANTSDEAIRYLKDRVKQLLRFGVSLVNISVVEHNNVISLLKKDDEYFISIYILEQNRGKGTYFDLLKKAKEDYNLDETKVLTIPDCNLQKFLSSKNISFEIINPLSISGLTINNEVKNVDYFIEYDLISEFWKDKFTVRSNIHYMNHIDEGLYIISILNGTERAMRIYALHGLLQEVYKNNALFFNGLDFVSSDVIIGAMEYRAVANNHLSYYDPSTLRLSEDDDVNMALIADKIQNRKDFEKFHLGVHSRSDELKAYFDRWLLKLGISNDEYLNLTNKIAVTD